jgi:hypothetical protein
VGKIGSKKGNFDGKNQFQKRKFDGKNQSQKGNFDGKINSQKGNLIAYVIARHFPRMSILPESIDGGEHQGKPRGAM